MTALTPIILVLMFVAALGLLINMVELLYSPRSNPMAEMIGTSAAAVSLFASTVYLVMVIAGYP
ncbi:MAG: hypothetical protein SF123_07595 [Chloroflexota bacterium]|nr:hypothetical protein [Chloroflexota bacterium]